MGLKKVLKINKEIDKAINILADGGVVLYPTDTVYGLGANIFNENAVKKVFKIKNRSFSKPLSILVSSVDCINLVAKISKNNKKFIESYLPGPFTFVLYKSSIVPNIITSGSNKVGVRVPDNEIACKLASLFPITTTSANLSNEKTLTSPDEILNQLNCDVDYVIDLGKLDSDKPSTIIDLSRGIPKIISR